MSRSRCRGASPPIRLFPLGKIVATPGVLELLDIAALNALTLLQRHQHGDWGNVPPEDAVENARAVTNGWRIVSSYSIGDRHRIWVITEADRSSTTLLLPEEY